PSNRLTCGQGSGHRYLTVRVPFMFGTDGCTEHWYLYVAAGSGGITYSCVPGSMTTGLATIFLPVESRMSASWTPTPASFMSKLITNHVPAGALSDSGLKSMFWAVRSRIVAPGPSEAWGAGVPPPAVPDQQSGERVALGSGLEVRA